MTLETHLQTGETTTCYCWVVRRRDDFTIGFTDHDEDVTVDGTTCLATTGITTTKISQFLGLSAGDVEVEGVIDDSNITEDDIRRGLYDGALVDIYMVNWTDPAEFKKLAAGSFGNLVERDNGGFMTEFRSLSYDLSQAEGRTYQRTCQAKLGDARCKVDLSSGLYRSSPSVLSFSGQTVVVSDLSGFDEQWFSLGKLIAADGTEHGIREQRGSVVHLWRRPGVDIEVGSTVTIIAGCKQDFATCTAKFSNGDNFQGFPYMPGVDSISSYPIRGKSDYDGGSLFQ